MALIVSLNVQKTSELLGFPNCKWSSIAIGSAPTDIIFLMDSATTPAAPLYGSRKQWEGLPSTEIAINLSFDIRKTDAPDSPGLTTVFVPTSWSYCLKIQDLLAKLGDDKTRRIVSLIFEGRAGFELETEFKYKGLVFGQSSKGDVS